MKINKNPSKIKTMFDEIAFCYDKMNNLISFKTHYLIKISAVKALNIRQNSKILDLCTGTGDFVKIISKFYRNCDVLGLDKSENMLKIAKIKNPDNEFILSDCTKTPFENSEFDYITMGFGLRNIENRAIALKEIFRILKNDGKFLHLDFGEHNFFSSVFDFTTSLFIKFFIKNKKAYEYLLASKRDFISPDELIEEMKSAGFKKFKKKYFLFKTICATIAQK